MGKRSIQSEADLKAEVDGLLGAFGVVGEADPSFDEEEDRPQLKNGEKASTPLPTADADALWGAPKKK